MRTEEPEMRTITGRWRNLGNGRLQRRWVLRKGKWVKGSLEPRGYWVFQTTEPTAHRGYSMQYKLRTGLLPKRIPPEWEGRLLTIRARAHPWSNGLGAYITHVTLAPPADTDPEVTLEALGR